MLSSLVRPNEANSLDVFMITDEIYCIVSTVNYLKVKDKSHYIVSADIN